MLTPDTANSAAQRFKLNCHWQDGYQQTPKEWNMRFELGADTLTY